MSNLVKLNWIDNTTTEFLGCLLEEFDRGNRVVILVRKGDADSVIARVRQRLSRLRAAMRNKRVPMKQFNLSIETFPWTNTKGIRCDAIVFRKIYTTKHRLREQLEGLYNADTIRDVESRGPVFSPAVDW